MSWFEPDEDRGAKDDGDAEDSPTDDIWGIRDRVGGMTGMNLLGKEWMQVRAELRVTS